MGSDPEKASSRLNQKTIGVTNRIWLILILFLALILLTKSILPSETQDPRHRLLHTDLKPKNYLNATNGDTVPFAFCPALGPGDELAAKYDALTLSKTRLHMGSGARVQRVITRALAGFPVTISVIGGSSKHLFHPSSLPLHVHHQDTVHMFVSNPVYHPIHPRFLGIPSLRSMTILLTRSSFQYLLVMVLAMTHCHLHVTHPVSSIGGIAYSLIRRQNSQTGPCDEQTRVTFPSATRTMYQTSRTSLSLSWM